MLRIATVALVLAAFPAASSAAHRAVHPVTPGLVAKVVACDVTSTDRAATFYARMDTLPLASKLQVRFQLLERLGRDDSWDRLGLPGAPQGDHPPARGE